MKKIILVCLLLSSCASLKGEVYSNIREGDPTQKLIDQLGEPDETRPSDRIPGGTAWIYKRRSQMCGFSTEDGIIKAISCVDNPNYRNPIGAFFSGFAQGMSNSHQQQAQQPRPINCTSTQLGNNISTTCY